MSAQICNQCQAKCIFKARPRDEELFGAPCDSCNEIICKKCSNISTTEAHALTIIQRNIMFYCGNCKSTLKDFPNFKKLLERYDTLKTESAVKDRKIEFLKNKLEEETIELQKGMGNLLNDNREKDIYIKRLKRNTDDFTDSVFLAEQDFSTKLNELKRDNMNLNKELLKLAEQNKQLSSEAYELKGKLDDLSKQNVQLENLKKSLMVSIETLSVESETYMSDLKKANIKISELYAGLDKVKYAGEISSGGPTSVAVGSVPSADTPTDVINNNDPSDKTNSDGSSKPNKIVILTDDFGRKIYGPLSKLLEQFSVQVVCKPFAKFSALVVDADCYVQNLGNSDYVIVLAGINNNDISTKDITLLADKCFRTNLIFSMLPVNGALDYYWCKFSVVNNKMLSVVNNLKRFSVSIDLLDTTNQFSPRDFIKSKPYLNSKGLSKISMLIKSTIGSFGETRIRY